MHVVHCAEFDKAWNLSTIFCKYVPNIIQIGVKTQNQLKITINIFNLQ
jgi:hypothetical protein